MSSILKYVINYTKFLKSQINNNNNVYKLKFNQGTGLEAQWMSTINVLAGFCIAISLLLVFLSHLALQICLRMSNDSRPKTKIISLIMKIKIQIWKSESLCYGHDKLPFVASPALLHLFSWLLAEGVQLVDMVPETSTLIALTRRCDLILHQTLNW